MKRCKRCLRLNPPAADGADKRFAAAARPRSSRWQARVRAACLAFAAFVVALAPALAYAADSSKAEEVDARLESYTTPVTLGESSSIMTWFFLGFLGVLALGVLFKNAKRTHLD